MSAPGAAFGRGSVVSVREQKRLNRAIPYYYESVVEMAKTDKQRFVDWMIENEVQEEREKELEMARKKATRGSGK